MLQSSDKWLLVYVAHSFNSTTPWGSWESIFSLDEKSFPSLPVDFLIWQSADDHEQFSETVT